MPFELQIALRYLLAKRRQVFISVISLVSTLGVTVGVMALVIALAIMTGLQQELRDRILGAMAHVYVWHEGGVEDYRAEAARLKEIPGVLGAAPASLGKALISSQRGDMFITLKGIDPELERGVTEIAAAMTGGSLDELTPKDGDGLPGIVIGHSQSQLTVNSFPADASIDVVAVTVVGGLTVTLGPLIGALLMVGLPALYGMGTAGQAALA